MAWFWSSPSAETQAPPPPSNTIPKPTTNSVTPPPNPDPPSSSSSLDSFIQNLEADTRITSTKYTRVPQAPSPTHSSSTSTSEEQPIRPIGKIEDELLPTEVSISAAFDAAFYCQSLGGKFNDLYRYGHMQSCSGHWKEFWFAMKMRSTREPIKTEMIKDYYRQKHLKYKINPSSEDVWKSRDEFVKPEHAFPYSFPDEDISDEEWNARQEAQRKQIRQQKFGNNGVAPGTSGFA